MIWCWKTAKLYLKQPWWNLFNTVKANVMKSLHCDEINLLRIQSEFQQLLLLAIAHRLTGKHIRTILPEIIIHWLFHAVIQTVTILGHISTLHDNPSILHWFTDYNHELIINWVKSNFFSLIIYNTYMRLEMGDLAKSQFD